MLTLLYRNTSYTLPFAHRTNIDRLDLSPRGNLLLTVDETGRAILTNFQRRISIHHFSFKGRVTALKFSPSGRHFAVGVGRRLQIWQTPSTPGTETNGEIEFAPFVLHRDLAAHFDSVSTIEWSSDSRFLLTASKDLTARVWSLDPEDGFEPTTLAGHRQGVVAAYFDSEQEKVSPTIGFVLLTCSNTAVDLHRQPRWSPFPLGVCDQERPRNGRGHCGSPVEDCEEGLLHAERC